MLTLSTSSLPATAPASLKVLVRARTGQRSSSPTMLSALAVRISRFPCVIIFIWPQRQQAHRDFIAASPETRDGGLASAPRGPARLLDATLDVHRYRRVLQTFYGFYAPVEIDLARLTATELPLGFPLRARAELIERDLLALGLSPAEIVALPLCRDRPELSCLEDLAGSLYVLEGACLGGQVLTPLLHRRLGLAKDGGAAFFAGDGERTLPRWTVVVAWLDGLPRTGASTAKIIGAANATFDALARWARLPEGD